MALSFLGGINAPLGALADYGKNKLISALKPNVQPTSNYNAQLQATHAANVAKLPPPVNVSAARTSASTSLPSLSVQKKNGAPPPPPPPPVPYGGRPALTDPAMVGGVIMTQNKLPPTPTSSNPPSGWDAETYANFKKANPSLEPDQEDTYRMNKASEDYAIKERQKYLQQSYLSTLNQSPDVAAANTALGDVASKQAADTAAARSAYSQRVGAINEQSTLQPFLTGRQAMAGNELANQMAAIEAASGAQTLPLQARLAQAQAAQQSAQERAKAELGFATPVKSDFQTVSEGQSIIDPATGRVVYQGTPKAAVKKEAQVIGSESTGYYERQDDGTYKQVVSPVVKNIDVKPPVTKEIDGKTYQWNESTQAWETPKTSISAPNPQKIAAFNQKINDIDALLNNQAGLAVSVGLDAFNPFGDDRSGSLGVRGEKSNFLAGVSQLIQKETLDGLLALKAQGGTLGALSDREALMLQESASKLGAWAIKDKNGKITGFQARENDVKNELAKLRKNAENLRDLASGKNPYDPNYKADSGAGVQNGIITDPNAFLNSFSNEGSVSVNARTGSLSEKYESGGNPGSIGYDSTGGLSYGTYQLAHSNAQRFVAQSPFAADFNGLAFNSQQWQNKWKEVANRDPQGFGAAQKDYIAQTHYAPQITRLAKAGIDVARLSPVLQDVIWSTAVQHGANTDIVEKAIRQAGVGAKDADIINAIYNERWSGGMRFASSTPAVRSAVLNRLENEKRDAISMLG